MKRSEIKRRPLSDTALAGLEPDLKEYRELDANGLYFRVKPDGQKSWQLRYKKPTASGPGWGLADTPRSAAHQPEQRLQIFAPIRPKAETRW